MAKDLKELEKTLSLKFINKQLLKSAFIHRSYLNEHPDEKLPHNERLEFLGDAVLGFVVSKFLYKNYPSHPEGDLTNFRSSVVNTRSLAKASSLLDLGGYLFLSKGEEVTGGRGRQFILANTLESLIGAIYLDLGLSESENFIEKKLLNNLPEIIAKKLYKDFKSVFQEKVQEKMGSTPTYRVIEERGPDHEKTFKVGVSVNKKLLAEGFGPSKQSAEQEAAKMALENWRDSK